jgi:hypothetical protein
MALAAKADSGECGNYREKETEREREKERERDGERESKENLLLLCGLIVFGMKEISPWEGNSVYVGINCRILPLRRRRRRRRRRRGGVERGKRGMRPGALKTKLKNTLTKCLAQTQHATLNTPTWKMGFGGSTTSMGLTEWSRAGSFLLFPKRTGESHKGFGKSCLSSTIPSTIWDKKASYLLWTAAQKAEEEAIRRRPGPAGRCRCDGARAPWRQHRARMMAHCDNPDGPRALTSICAAAAAAAVVVEGVEAVCKSTLRTSGERRGRGRGEETARRGALVERVWQWRTRRVLATTYLRV